MSSTKNEHEGKDRKLMEEVRDVIRLHHYSIHTERSYCDWITRYVKFHKMKSREDLKEGEAKIESFLTYLAVKEKILHEKDLSEGFGDVYLPYALERKYKNASKEWQWQYVFPSVNRSKDPRSGMVRRHHIDPSVINKTIRSAVKEAGIHKHITAHTFRHSFATHLLQRGPISKRFRIYLGMKMCPRP